MLAAQMPFRQPARPAYSLCSTSACLIPTSLLQAMDMISIAQSTGDISADIYRQKSAKPIGTPQLAGLEKHNQKLQEEMQAAQNPFTNGTSTSAATLPHGALLLAGNLHMPMQALDLHSLCNRRCRSVIHFALMLASVQALQISAILGHCAYPHTHLQNCA